MISRLVWCALPLCGKTTPSKAVASSLRTRPNYSRAVNRLSAGNVIGRVEDVAPSKSPLSLDWFPSATKVRSGGESDIHSPIHSPGNRGTRLRKFTEKRREITENADLTRCKGGTPSRVTAFPLGKAGGRLREVPP